MNTFAQLITEWPDGRAGFARDLGLSYATVQSMELRDSISTDYWPAITDLAQEKGVAGISTARLMEMRQARRERGPLGVRPDVFGKAENCSA